jgi:hypothetical protein
MERYVDVFVREHPPKWEEENVADYLDRFMDWIRERGGGWPDEVKRKDERIEELEGFLHDVGVLPCGCIKDQQTCGRCGVQSDR